jgi:hypothetical protein
MGCITVFVLWKICERITCGLFFTKEALINGCLFLLDLLLLLHIVTVVFSFSLTKAFLLLLMGNRYELY